MNTDKSSSKATATEGEIESQRAKWAKRQLAQHLDFAKQFSFHTSSTFMDYLHGDVNEAEAELACDYEYARESKKLWELARERNKLLADAKVTCEGAAIHIVESHPGDWPTNPILMVELLLCESFPKKDWNELGQQERAKMTRHYRPKVIPLSMTDACTLKSLGVFDKFREMGQKAEPVVKDVPPVAKSDPMKFVPPLLPQHPSRPELYYALFNLDYSKSETELVSEFREWLRLSENKERLQHYRKSKTGTTGKPLDRLKDLAAWRLYRECGNDWNKANDFAKHNRKRFTAQKICEWCKTKEERAKYSNGDPMPFRDAKSKMQQQANGRTISIPANTADLLGEDADAREAQRSAWKHLTETMLQEFAMPSSLMLAMFVELEKLEKLASKD